MSSQSWLDLRIKRINYFLRVVPVSIIYYKPKQFITSTHTNYFDRIFKERGAKPRLSWTIIQSHFNLSTSRQLYFLSIPAGVTCETPKKPTIITYPANLSTSLLTLFSTTASFKAPCPERTAHYTAFLLFVKRLFLRMLIYR